MMYRGELERVARLLGSQLEREKKLHSVIEQMVGHSQNIHSQAQMLASQRPGSNQIHQFLEQYLGQHGELLNQTLGQSAAATQALSAHHQSVQQMKEPLITAENEF